MAQDEEKVAYRFKDPGFGVRADNAYLLADGAMFARLCEIVDRNRSLYSRILGHSAKDVGEWLDAVLAPLVAKYQDGKPGWRMPTRNKIWHVLHGVTEPFRCPTCGKTVFGKVLTIFQERPPFCSRHCANSNPGSIQKAKNTKTELYGSPTFNNREKFRQTLSEMPDERISEWRNSILNSFREKYGADSYMATSEFREKAADWVRRTYGERYDNVLQVPEVRRANEEKNLAEHGHPRWSNWEKGRETCMRNHGVDVIFKSSEFREKVRAEMVEKYGVPYPAQNRYEFDGERFDSLPELAFYVWAKDSGMNVARNKTISFGFVFDGREHRYWPDFLLDGKPVEIKGDQFFREDGTMYCPYRRPDDTDQEYLAICEKYRAKGQCMVDNNVRVIRSDEYNKYVEYVKIKYGKDFFNKYKKAATI